MGREEVIHQPVLLQEVVSAIRPCAEGVYADLTLGCGGHAGALLEESRPSGVVLGLDCDPEVLEIARSALKAYGNRVQIRHGNFNNAAEIYEAYLGKTDGVIMDLGLSSYQLDSPRRGFSIFKDGPLDLRMDPTQPFSGRELVNKGRGEELLFAIGTLGEEPKAKAIVKAILEQRRERPLLHTSDLRQVVEKTYNRKGGKIHPATRTFQGLRMLLNRERENLQGGLAEAFRLLKKGGRLAVIAFHSGEDRIVKDFIKDRAAKGEAENLTRKPIRPALFEIRKNRRSRSARLRVAELR